MENVNASTYGFFDNTIMGQSAIFHKINNIHAPGGTLGQWPIKGLGKYLFPTFARNVFWENPRNDDGWEGLYYLHNYSFWIKNANIWVAKTYILRGKAVPGCWAQSWWLFFDQLLVRGISNNFVNRSSHEPVNLFPTCNSPCFTWPRTAISHVVTELNTH